MKNKTFVFATIIMAFIVGTILVPAVGAQTSRVNAAPRQAPFSRGFNFPHWLEANSAQEIPFGRYTEQDFADVKSLGADVIRLPIKLFSMTSGAPDYTLDPLFLRYLDIAVDWAEKYKLFIIIDNHVDDHGKSVENDVDKILLPVWAQIAQRYSNRSDYVVYEIFNEPNGISDRRWGEVQGRAIETIRKFDTKHSIIVTGADWSSIDKLNTLPRYSDTNLIYTFHFYAPHIFTHQGARNVGEPLWEILTGIPFPPDRSRMPSMPSALRGTHLERVYNNYSREGDPSSIYSVFDKAVAFSRQRNVPIYCGEFGVMQTVPQEDRARWYQIVAEALDSRNISRTGWDYLGFAGFGVFDVVGGDFNRDLTVEVVRALGFTPPPQTPRQPLNAGFTFYDDYPNRRLSIDNWGDADFSLYDTNNAQGIYSIRWGNADRYNAFAFTFNRIEDFTRLVSEGYSIEFKARATRPVNFDIYFFNSENPIPWRMRYTVNLTSGNIWQTIRVPLRNMQEQGAWVEATQQWLTPRGEFSWANVRQLVFNAEHSDLKGITVWIDDVKITR